MDDGAGDDVGEWKKKYHTVFEKYRIAAYELGTERLKSSFFEMAMNLGDEDTERYRVFCKKMYDALDGEEALRAELEREIALVTRERDELLEEKQALVVSAKGGADELLRFQQQLKEKSAEATSCRDELAKEKASMKEMEQRNKELKIRVSSLEEDSLGTRDTLEKVKSEAEALVVQLEKSVEERSDVMELLEGERKARAGSGLEKVALGKEVERLKEQVATMMLEKVRLEGEAAQHLALRGQLEQHTEALRKGREQVVAGLQNQIQNLSAQAEEQRQLRVVAETKVKELSAAVTKLESEVSQKDAISHGKNNVATQEIQQLKIKHDVFEAQRADMQKTLDKKNQELTSLQKKISEQAATIAELKADQEHRMEGGVDDVLDRIVDVMGPPEEASSPPLSQIRQNAMQQDSEMEELQSPQTMKEEEASPPRATRIPTTTASDKVGPSQVLEEENVAPATAAKGKARTGKRKEKKPVVNRMFDQPLDALGGRTLLEAEDRRDDAIRPFAFLPSTRSVASTSSKGAKRKLGQHLFNNQTDFSRRRTRRNK